MILHKSTIVFICYILTIKVCFSKIHLSEIVKISAAVTETVILLKAYSKGFDGFFLTQNTSQLLPNEDYNHIIYLLDNKQLLYGLFYNLFKNKVFIFWIYKNKNLANEFIRPCKLPIKASILFTLKPNKRLELYLNC